MDIEEIKRRTEELQAQNDIREKKLNEILKQNQLQSEYDEIYASIVWVNAKCLYQARQYFEKGGYLLDFTPIFTDEDEEVLDRAVNWIIDNQRWDDIAVLFRRCDWYRSDWCRKALLRCWEYIPKNKLYEITKNIYIKHGYYFPVHMISSLKDLRPDDYIDIYLDEVKNKEYLTVYRATFTDDIDAVKNELSWTLVDGVALNYYDFKHIASGKYGYIYSAKIKPEDIIFAYTTELEIVQYGDVYDVQRVDPETIRVPIEKASREIYESLMNSYMTVSLELDRLGRKYSRK